MKSSFKFAFRILAAIFYLSSLASFILFSLSGTSSHENFMTLYVLGMAIFFQVCAVGESVSDK